MDSARDHDRIVFGLGTAGIATTLIVGTCLGWSQHDWGVGADVSLVYIAILSTVWALLYGCRSAWAASPLGRAVLAQSVIMAAVLTQAAVSNWVADDYPAREQVRYVLYTLGAVTYVVMVIALWREQQRDRGRR